MDYSIGFFASSGYMGALVHPGWSGWRMEVQGFILSDIAHMLMSIHIAHLELLILFMDLVVVISDQINAAQADLLNLI